MPEWHSFLVFVGAGLLLNITPGPDVLYIVGRSISQGRLAGIVSVLGITAGSLVHITAAVLGLSALMVGTPWAYAAIRYAGAAYLVWLGVRALLTRSTTAQVRTPARAALGVIFRQGMLTNMLNPKVALFFLAFLPQFIDQSRGPVALQFLFLGVVFVFNGVLVCLGYVFAASWVGARLATRTGVSAWLNRAMAGIFIALGLRLALGTRR